MFTEKLKKFNPELFRERLDEDQMHTLKMLIQTFLPKTGEKRKYHSNEFNFIHITIDQLFMKYCQHGVHDQDLIDAFVDLGYACYINSMAHFSVYKIKKDEGIFLQHVYDEYRKIRFEYGIHDTHSFHFDVSAKRVGELKNSMLIVPLRDGNLEKTIIPGIQMKER